MSKRYFVLSLLLVFILTAGLSLAQSPGNNTSKIAENKSVPVSSEKPTASPTNNSSTVTNVESANPKSNSSETAKAASEIAKMSGIWSVMGIKPDQITMALQEDGSDLFGQAKYEPSKGDAWNAVVVGSVSGDNVTLAVTSMDGKEQVSAMLSGTFADDAFSGKFFDAGKGNNISNRGEFSATLINPEITDYSPTTVTAQVASQPKAQTSTQTTVSNAPTTSTTTTVGNQTTTTQSSETVSGKKAIHNVEQDWDKLGPGGDLSGVPPGMGGGF